MGMVYTMELLWVMYRPLSFYLCPLCINNCMFALRMFNLCMEPQTVHLLIIPYFSVHNGAYPKHCSCSEFMREFQRPVMAVNRNSQNKNMEKRVQKTAFGTCLFYSTYVVYFIMKLIKTLTGNSQAVWKL